MSAAALKAPFPWFGGKSRAAHLIWPRLGEVPNYIEPFAGSLAVLLARPEKPAGAASRTETVNDLDGYVANFWRAVRADPEAVAGYADWPVNEADLHARHVWLLGKRDGLLERLMGDPDWYDPKVAGWWVWGQSAWFGRGWCTGRGPWSSVDGRFVKGVGGLGVQRGLPHLGIAGQGVNSQRDIYDWFEALADRLRDVRVTCGDWTRVTTRAPMLGNWRSVGVVLDPPYDMAERDQAIYASDTPGISAAVREWALSVGDDHRYRIALCGYEGEHDMPPSWECVPWKANGGYGNQSNGRARTNPHRERIWFSPHCLRPGRDQQGVMFE